MKCRKWILHHVVVIRISRSSLSVPSKCTLWRTTQDHMTLRKALNQFACRRRSIWNNNENTKWFTFRRRWNILDVNSSQWLTNKCDEVEIKGRTRNERSQFRSNTQRTLNSTSFVCVCECVCVSTLVPKWERKWRGKKRSVRVTLYIFNLPFSSSSYGNFLFASNFHEKRKFYF